MCVCVVGGVFVCAFVVVGVVVVVVCVCVYSFVCVWLSVFVCLCVCVYSFVCVFVCVFVLTLHLSRTNPPDEAALRSGAFTPCGNFNAIIHVNDLPQAPASNPTQGR